MVLTSNHDVYTTGFGQTGQLGHGDEESKTVFTWVKKLGGKKVSSIYAGGHHTWCVIDSDNKTISNYRPPSPLRTPVMSSPLNMTQTKLHKGDTSMDNSLIKEKRGRNDIGLEHMSLFLIFSDQAKSHRFARVTLDERQLPLFNRTFSEYIKSIGDEEGGLAYYNIQKDDDLFQMVREFYHRFQEPNQRT